MNEELEKIVNELDSLISSMATTIRFQQTITEHFTSLNPTPFESRVAYMRMIAFAPVIEDRLIDDEEKTESIWHRLTDIKNKMGVAV